MKLRQIRLETVRRFTTAVVIDGIADGLNLLSAPNEAGKSTVFDALMALFDYPHRSQAAPVKALRPHAGGGPTVSVTLEVGGVTYTVQKRWLRSPMAEVRQGARLIAQADAAEAWIADLALGTKSGGPGALVWVRQGQTGLGAEGAEVRRDLLSSVAGEVAAATGGQRMDLVRDAVQAALDRLITVATGQPKAGGPLRTAEDRCASLAETVADYTARAARLSEHLGRRRAVERSLHERTADEAEAARADRLAKARRAQAEAERYTDRLTAAEAKRRAAEAAAERVEAERTAIAQARAARDAAKGRLAAAIEADQLAQATLAAAQSAEQATAAAAQSTAARAAEETRALQDALRAEAASVAAERRAAIALQLNQAEAAADEIAKGAAIVNSGPDAETADRIQGLERDVDRARSLRKAQAVTATMRYDDPPSGAVTLDGTALDDGVPLPLPDGGILRLPGLGRLEVRPGSSGPKDDLGAAETALARALSTAGFESAEALRSARAAVTAAERSVAAAEAALKIAAPDGIDALRAMLAPEPASPSGDPQPRPVAEAQTAAAEAAAAAETAVRQQETARAEASKAQARAATDAAEKRAAEAAVLDADATLASLTDRHGLTDAEALTRHATKAAMEANAARAVAQQEHQQLLADAPNLDATGAALGRAEAVDREARREVAELREERERLDGAIDTMASAGLEEELADLRERLTAAEAERDAFRFELAVLQRLSAALDAARAEAQDRYFAPVMAELTPLLSTILPDAQLDLDEATILPKTLSRAGVTEALPTLSGGTQEQIAVLVRLAFARLAAGQGKAAPVILDDALVFTDDDRIERMFDALHTQARDLQILVLTCRERAFRDLGGHRLHIAPAEAAP